MFKKNASTYSKLVFSSVLIYIDTLSRRYSDKKLKIAKGIKGNS